MILSSGTVRGALAATAFDLGLSGDNAAGIGGLASELKDPSEQKRAIRIGLGIALALRLVGLFFVTSLFEVPWLINIASLWIGAMAYKMARDAESEETGDSRLVSLVMRVVKRRNPSQYHIVIVQIAATDFALSLDNLSGVSAIAQGNRVIAIGGTVMSVVILLTLSKWVTKLINRFGWLLYVAAAWLAVLAANMAVKGLPLTSLEIWGIRLTALLTVAPFIVRRWHNLKRRRGGTDS
jgi:predicted tellurium resistance membrane protein TerC